MSDTLTQLRNTVNGAVASSCIAGGSVIKANAEGFDPEYLNYGGLLPNGLYIRIDTIEGDHIYISAFEIDKAISIIGDMSMGKANTADLVALALEVEHKASDMDIELIQSELATKANKSRVDSLADSIKDKVSRTEFENLQLTVGDKADRLTVDNIINTLDDIVSDDRLNIALQELGTKADKQTVETLKADINTLKNTVKNIADSATVEAIEMQIEHLNDELNKKLTSDDLQTVQTNISNVSVKTADLLERMVAVEGGLKQKASTVYVQTQVSEVNDAVTALAGKVDTKADKSELATKADKDALHTLSNRVTTISNETNDRLERIEDGYDEMNGNITEKVNTSVNLALGDINRTLSSKADKSSVLENISSLSSRVTNVERTHSTDIGQVRGEIEELECDFTNNLNELQATVYTQSRLINSQATQISQLQETDKKYSEQIGNEWVRVMTPEEYNRLAPVGSVYGDGKPNPYAKKPNVIYMLVRYNKPISVYIGDVLIAKAESKGPQGFAYNFPIPF